MILKCFKLFIILIILIITFQTCYLHEHTHDHQHHGHLHFENEEPSFKYSRAANEKAAQEKHSSQSHKSHTIEIKDVWLHAMCSTLLISAAPFFILFLVPLDNSKEKQPLLKILLAFASGGLLGDAFLHLIPHAAMATEGHTHSHSHQHEEEEHGHDMSVGLWVLAGIVTFLVVEKTVRILKGGHSHSHSHSVQPKNVKESKETEKESKDKESKSKNEKSSEKNLQKAKTSPKKVKDASSEETKNSDIKVAGYLNLAADFSHNFTDGLAIGSSYLAGNTIGIVTTITILLHEVPHEIGDFAILLQSGVSKKNAMLLQLSTAIGALIGTAVSLLAQNTSGVSAASWILPFTAGGFIYIALVSVIPELLDEENPSLYQTFMQVLAMLGGVYMMVIIAQYE